MSRRRFDPSSLVAGVLFMAVAVRYLDAADGGHGVGYVWAVPAALAVVVVVAVLRLVFRRRRDG